MSANENDEIALDGEGKFVRGMIPAVTAVGLTLGSAACGDAADEDDSIDEDDFRSFCSRMEACAPQDFESNFGSIDSCTSNYDASLAYYLDTSNPGVIEACVDAVSDYWSCLTSAAYCDNGSFEFPQMNPCDTEITQFEQACPTGSS